MSTKPKIEVWSGAGKKYVSVCGDYGTVHLASGRTRRKALTRAMRVFDRLWDRMEEMLVDEEQRAAGRER